MFIFKKGGRSLTVSKNSEPFAFKLASLLSHSPQLYRRLESQQPHNNSNLITSSLPRGRREMKNWSSPKAQTPENYLTLLAASWRAPFSGLLFIWTDSGLMVYTPLTAHFPTNVWKQSVATIWYQNCLRQHYQLGLTRGWSKNLKNSNSNKRWRKEIWVPKLTCYLKCPVSIKKLWDTKRSMAYA